MLSTLRSRVSSVPCWSDAYSIGNEWLDEQHRKLLEIGGKACDVFAAPAVSDADFRDLLCDFAETLRAQLTNEEKALARNSYPYLATHIAEHNAFRAAFAELLQKADNRSFYRKELLKLIADFTSNHVLAADVACKDYLRARKPAPAQFSC